MELANILHELWQRKLLLVLAAVLAVFVGLSSTYEVSLTPPAVEARTLVIGTARTQLLVDSPSSSVGALPRSGLEGGGNDDFTQDQLANRSLGLRAQVLSRVMASEEVLERIAKRLRVKESKIEGTPPADIAESGAVAQSEPAAPERAAEVIKENNLYRFSLLDNGDVPVISVFAQAPSGKKALALADAIPVATEAYLRVLQRRRGDSRPLTDSQKVNIRQLGTASGGSVSSQPNRNLAIGVGIFTFLALALFILLLSRVVSALRMRSRLSALPGNGLPDERPLPPFS